jgi:hypothetical protein
MSDTLDRADDVVRPGTYQTVVRPHQLKRTDIFTEVLSEAAAPGRKVHTRSVVIEKVTCGEITYRGRLVPVLFVHGYDERLKHPVIFTRTGWEFLEVARVGEAPQYRRALESLNQVSQFVY